MSIITNDVSPSRDTDARDRADMERLVSGHPAALDDLMERHATPVFQFLCRMLGDENDANDLAQETFVRVFRSCKSFRANEKFSTWLYSIAANLAKNHFRWRSRHPNVSLEAQTESENKIADVLPSDARSPLEETVAAERVEAVRAAVHALPGDFRDAIVLCEWEDRTVADAARILGATPKAIESRLYRGRNLLRDRLKSWL
ncbi:MAG TPA: sigma-70 family RNA polymerase sigma factor [Verrucomicrobiae bacterium]|nr:sigma-70 family RNA polymerase sigma factor [Verrucomicrobiae bacterium]